MTDQTPNENPSGLPGSPTVHQLRRSRTDRVVTGVAGGLGEYFGIDPVIFRVLFAVLSFFGGAGLAAYLVFWILIPEADVETSILDRSVEHLRARRVPPWVVITGGALLVWVMWFSWWEPRPSFAAFLVLALVLVYLTRRVGSAPPPSVPPAPLTPSGAPAVAETAETADAFAAPPVPPVAAQPLVAPLTDSRRAMQSWFAEANAAHRQRVYRRRPIKIAAAIALAAGWGITAAADVSGRVAFPVYLWVGLAVLTTALVASIVARRATWSLVPGIVLITAAAVIFGGTSASLRDGSGQISWRPPAAGQLTDQRQFAGETTVDLSAIRSLEQARTITLTQAAGRIELRLPSTLNVIVRGKVHLGDIEVGDSRRAGDYVSGWNVALDVAPVAGSATGEPLTINVDLTAGSLRIERV